MRSGLADTCVSRAGSHDAVAERQGSALQKHNTPVRLRVASPDVLFLLPRLLLRRLRGLLRGRFLCGRLLRRRFLRAWLLAALLRGLLLFGFDSQSGSRLATNGVVDKKLFEHLITAQRREIVIVVNLLRARKVERERASDMTECFGSFAESARDAREVEVHVVAADEHV